MKFEQTRVQQSPCRLSTIRTRDQDDPHDDAHPEGRIVQKGNQEQDDEFDFWTECYASDDDEIPTKQITPLVQSCQRDPEALVLSLINQDLLYLKKGIEEYDVFSIVYEPVHGIIYTNSKKEKRVMRH
ncbi:hypothetical protein Tco_0035820 [Tanacetum coccineum]